jgi:hypothetical protein
MRRRHSGPAANAGWLAPEGEASARSRNQTALLRTSFRQCVLDTHCPRFPKPLRPPADSSFTSAGARRGCRCTHRAPRDFFISDTSRGPSLLVGLSSYSIHRPAGPNSEPGIGNRSQLVSGLPILGAGRLWLEPLGRSGKTCASSTLKKLQRGQCLPFASQRSHQKEQLRFGSKRSRRVSQAQAERSQ